MKIVLFSYDAGIVTAQIIGHDECHRPKTEHSCGRSVTNQKKLLCPPCLGEALRRGSIIETTIFMAEVI
jgi:hypothetical protein